MHKVSSVIAFDFLSLSNLYFSVHPAHIAFTLLNEGASPSTEVPGGPPAQSGGAPLFASVVSRAGGDPVRLNQSLVPYTVLILFLGRYQTRSPKAYRPSTSSEPPA